MKKWHSKRNRLYHWTSFIAATHSSLHMIHHCLSCIIAYRLSLHTRHLLWIYTLFSLNMIYHCVLFISLHIMCRRTSRIMAHLMQRTAAHCNALQHTATHCNTLQHTTTHCHCTSRIIAHLPSPPIIYRLHIIHHCISFISIANGSSLWHMGYLLCIWDVFIAYLISVHRISCVLKCLYDITCHIDDIACMWHESFMYVTWRYRVFWAIFNYPCLVEQMSCCHVI